MGKGMMRRAAVGSLMGAMGATRSVGGSINIGIEQSVRRFFAVLQPWLVFLVVIPFFSALAHALFGDTDWRLLVMYYLVAGTFLSRLAYKYTRSSHQESRVTNAATMAAVVALIGAATIFGFTNKYVSSTWFAVGTVLVIAWMIRYRSRTEATSDTISWNNATQNAGDTEPSTLQILANEAGRVRGIVSYRPGVAALSQLTGRKEQLASAMGTTQDGFKVSTSPDLKPHQAIVDVIFEEQIKGDLEYTPGEFDGGSIADGPLIIGKYENGEPVEVHLYDAKNKSARHLVISGMNGSGKSVAARNILTELFGRNDVNVIASDTVKGWQTLGKAAPGLDWFLTQKPESEQMLETMKKVITARADWLGRNGFDGWEKDCGLNFIVLLIEEAPELVRDSDDFISLTATARSAGIAIIASIQRASYSNMPTDARSQFPSAMCFGTKKSGDAAFVLGADLIERGADPSKWKANFPGFAYFIGPHIPEDMETTKLKTNNIDPQLMLERATARGIVPFDDVTYRVIKKIYDAYLANINVSDYERALSDEPEPLVEEADELDQNLPDEISEPDVEVKFGDPTDEAKTTPAQAHSNFAKFLADVYETEEKLFRPKDAMKVALASNRKRNWINTMIDKFTEAGIVVKEEVGLATYRVTRMPD